MKNKSQLGKTGALALRRRAQRLIRDPQRLRALLGRSMSKARRRAGVLSEVWEALMSLFRMIRAWVDGRYRDVPWKSVVLAVSAILYFAMPLDLVPDWILALGYFDDAAVIAWVARSIKRDLDDFVQWESQQEGAGRGSMKGSS